MKIDKRRKAILIGDKTYKDSVPNYRILSSGNLLPEGPITRYYGWPSKYDKPMIHQVATADFVTRHKRGLILNDIGTGKTLIIDWLIDFLQKEKIIKRALIVAPLSTLQSVHGDELKWSLPHLSYAVLTGSKQKRIRALGTKKDIYIINFEGVKVLSEELAARDDIDCVFIDEVAKLRNQGTDLWKTFHSLFGIETGKMVWGLTGSPMPRAPTDCYAQAKLLNPDALPQQTHWRTGEQVPIPFYKFRELVMTQKHEFLWLPKEGWEDICYKSLQPSIRFTKNECGDLPECVTETRSVTMSAVQKKLYEAMRKDMVIEIGDKKITAVNSGIKAMKLVQITAGGVYDSEGTAHTVSCPSKIKELIDIVDECAPEHVLVFVPFKSSVDYVCRELKAMFGSVSKVTGDTNDKDREEIFKSFVHDNLRLIVAVPDCMSHGLNLQSKCATIVWFAPIRRYDIYEQACGRVDRKGQTRKTTIVHLESSPAERELYTKLNQKGINQDMLRKILEKRA